MSSLLKIASLALAVMVSCARGGPVQYIFEGTATGTANEDFDQAHFSITLSGDTASINRVGDKLFEIPVAGIIHIDGLGTGVIQEQLHLWSDFTNPAGAVNTGPAVGLSIYSFDGGQILNMHNPAFDGFALDRSIGPIINIDPSAFQGGPPQTEIGTVNFYSVQDATFRATTAAAAIPLPPALWPGMFMLAALCLCLKPRHRAL